MTFEGQVDRKLVVRYECSSMPHVGKESLDREEYLLTRKLAVVEDLQDMVCDLSEKL